jgi:hypothetical protein
MVLLSTVSVRSGSMGEAIARSATSARGSNANGTFLFISFGCLLSRTNPRVRQQTKTLMLCLLWFLIVLAETTAAQGSNAGHDSYSIQPPPPVDHICSRTCSRPTQVQRSQPVQRKSWTTRLITLSLEGESGCKSGACAVLFTEPVTSEPTLMVS